MAFALVFAIFLVLMAVLVIFVLRFAVQQGRRRQPGRTGPATGEVEESQSDSAAGSPPERDVGSG